MLIGVTGRKGSGKDTLIKRTNGSVTKMAGPIKNMLRVLYDEAGLEPEDIERKIEGDLKEVPCEVLGGATPRWAMQSLGTEWAKMVDPTHTLWSRIWSRKVEPELLDGMPVFVTDIRFEHERRALKALGGYLVRVVRPDQGECSDEHPSEVEMLNLEVDATIQNEGSVSDLQKKFDTIRKDLME